MSVIMAVMFMPARALPMPGVSMRVIVRAVSMVVTIVVVAVIVVRWLRAVLVPAVLVVVTHTSFARARGMHARAQGKPSVSWQGPEAGRADEAARDHSTVRVIRLGEAAWPVKKLPKDELVTTTRSGSLRTSSDAGPSSGLPWSRVSLLPSGPARPMRLP
jgi:hypothetical protein